MSPEERQQMARLLSERSGVTFDQTHDDPRGLAQMSSQVQTQQPDGLAGLLGGLGGGGLGGLLGGGTGGGGGIGDMLSGVVGGNTGGRQSQQGQGGMGDMLQTPIMRAALGGIAAVAMKKMIGR